MRILLVSPHFYPENFKCNDVAFDLARRGHDVTVLSDIPNYPIGHFFDGYGIFKKRKEIVDGVKIFRTLVIPRGNGGGLRLALNYMSFAFFASIRAFFMALFNKKYDAILVHETSPITVGIPAVIIKKMQKTKMYFWVLDLWPESLQAAGGISNKYVLNFFTKVARSMYRNSDKILVSSRGFRSSIIEKGDFANKIEYFPNWAENVFTEGTAVSFNSIPQLPDGFKLMFAGNIGEAQDFEHIMDAALILKNQKDIHFVIVGDGRKKDWVDAFITKHNLKDTVHTLGRYPLETMPYFFKQADAMLLTLNDNLIFNLTVPAKLQAYMAASKPIVAMINGEAQELIKESKCGVVCSAGNSNCLAQNILKVKNMSSEKFLALGTNGYRYYSKNFVKDQCINHLVDILFRS